VDANGVNILMAAPSFLPDDAGPGTEPATYVLQSSPVLGAAANWQPAGDVIVGDDLMHTITVPLSGTSQFFRLVASYPTD
jgi:hypothetical protein